MIRLLALLLLLAGCGVQIDSRPSAPISSPPAVTSSQPVTAAHVTGTYPAHCTAVVTTSGVLPDERCTPGKVASSDRAVVCRAGYAAAHRPPARETNRVKVTAMRAYGVAGPAELDHLVPLSMGGSNDVANLWPQAGPVPNSKDKVEASLLVAVCERGADLTTAQRAIAQDWTTAVEAIQ